MQPITVLGLTAATLTTIAALPQIIKTIKLKETKDISLLMYTFLCSGMTLWLIYGIFIQNIPIILANSIALVLNLIVLIFKLKYK